MFHTYVLRSELTGRLYIGSTSNLRRRIDEHNAFGNLWVRNFAHLLHHSPLGFFRPRRKDPALRNLAGALRTEAVRCTLSVDRKVKTEIPALYSSRIGGSRMTCNAGSSRREAWQSWDEGRRGSLMRRMELSREAQSGNSPWLHSRRRGGPQRS